MRGARYTGGLTGFHVVFLADFEAGEDFVVGHGGVEEGGIDHESEV